MLRKQRSRQSTTDISYSDAAEIVSQVGEVYAHPNEQEQLVKPRSSLPCPWYIVRESFIVAYETEYLELPENLQESYHHLYRELAFFIGDELYKDFNSSLSVAAKNRIERVQKLGLSEDESSCRNHIAHIGVKAQTREEIWDRLVANETTCPRQHLIVLAETLGYCSSLFRVMWDEWAAYATLIAHQKKKVTGK